jgi:hypothetical protein
MKDKKIVEVSSAKATKSTMAAKPTRRIPWWVNVLLAICSYCTLKYVVPEIHLTHPTLQKLAQAAPTFAPLTTIPFLLLAAKQLYDVDIAGPTHGTPDDALDEKPDDEAEKQEQP